MAPRKPLNVLIVEDEALLAMELESLIEEAGHRVVGWAPSAKLAIDLIEEVEPDLAFIDVQLQGGSSGVEVASHVRDANPCTVVFLTANPKQIPEDFAGAAGVIPKPYTINNLMSCLAYLEEGIRWPPPSLPRPTVFSLSPGYQTSWSSSV